MIENRKKTVTSEKIDVKSISAEVLSPNIALVTANYLQTTDRSGNISFFDNLDVFLLEMKEGSWKIRKYIPHFNYPLIYNENIDKKFQTGRLAPLSRFDGLSSQMNGILLYFFEDYKKNGTTPAQLGKIVGSRFAKTWNQSRGFEGLASGFLWNLQTMSTYIEVLDRNENTAKYKCNPMLTISERWNVTKQEALEYCQNAFGEIADYMGGTCLIVEDGKFWILTFNKK
jgi:hypothetical protein